MRKPARGIALALVFLAGAAVQGKAQTEADAREGALRLGTGQPGGAYYALGRDIAEVSEVPLEVVETDGTLDNLDLLQSGGLDAAIVQNDLAHYLYRGQNGMTRFTGFEGLLPLFPEYVQIIVRADAGIDILSDLRGRRVSIGPRRSGTYQNAVHILDEIGLTEAVDFTPSYSAQGDSLAALESGTLDAAFMTGQPVALDEYPTLRRLLLPPRIIEGLSSDLPYYEARSIRGADGQTEPHLSVQALLVVSQDVSRRDGAVLTRAVIDGWPELRGRWPNLPALDTALSAQAVPFRGTVRTQLVRAGYVESKFWNWMAGLGVMVAILLVAGLCIYAQRARTTYNRLGESFDKEDLSLFQRSIDLVARCSPAILGFGSFLLLLGVSFWLVRLAENFYSRINNVDNEFIGMGPVDGFVWLLSFVASGFTLQDTFPLSYTGRVITALMALIGVMGPITLIFYLISELNRSQERTLKGEKRSKQTDHVLICGWNEKAPGIIFSLTGEDVDEKKDVTIVADLGDESPLEKHNFIRSRVRYCQGESASREALKRANAAEAKTAIVLCDYKHRAKGNLTGVLTVMNLRALQPDMHIAAELAFDKNVRHFVACGCNTLISPDKLIGRMAVLSTVSPLLCDFLFDVLTYNKEDKFTAETVEELERLMGEPMVGQPAYMAHQRLIRRGANLIGMVQGDQREHGLFDSSFGSADGEEQPLEQRHFLPLTTAEGRSTILKPHHTLIFSARNRDAIKTVRDVSTIDDAPELTGDEISIQRRKPASILLFGEEEYETIQSGLDVLNDQADVQALPAPGELMSREQLEKAVDPGRVYSHVILLTDRRRRNACTSDHDINEIDTASILNARLIKAFFAERQPGTPVQIIVEALNPKNRPMFKTAGADSTICSLTLVERFLTKEIYEKSQILDYVVALLNVTDRVHLYSFEVQEDDAICGKAYASLLKSRIEGFRLIGWLPKSQRDRMRNEHGDFDFHFRTVVGKRIVQTEVQPGDQLVAVLDRRKNDWLKREAPRQAAE